MKQAPFGSTGETIAVVGQGTWQMRDATACAAALQEGIRLGMTHIDTAELYEWRGGSETMLGNLLSKPARAGGTLRDHVFLASKVWPTNGSAKGVTSSCKDSLVRLQTDRLDLYYHHWRDGPMPLAETLGALADLRKAGWIRHIGVSNYGVSDLDEAKSILGPGNLAANQVQYHLEDRSCELEVLPWCRANGVALVAYSPFGQKRWIRDRKKLAALERIAASEGLTMRQAALAFLTRDPAVFAIPKAESIPHVTENAGGGRPLSRAAVADLDTLFPAAGVAGDVR
ncbi:MAG: aldo/keto reductase [Candidatus Thermoplasmatota archaeon]